MEGRKDPTGCRTQWVCLQMVNRWFSKLMGVETPWACPCLWSVFSWRYFLPLPFIPSVWKKTDSQPRVTRLNRVYSWAPLTLWCKTCLEFHKQLWPPAEARNQQYGYGVNPGRHQPMWPYRLEWCSGTVLPAEGGLDLGRWGSGFWGKANAEEVLPVGAGNPGLCLRHFFC